MNLYDLSTEYTTAISELMALVESGDIDNKTFNDTIEGLSGELENKSKNIALYTKNLKSFIEAVKAEESLLKRKRELAQKRIDWLNEYLLTNMQRCNITQIDCDFFTIKRKKCPPSVVITGAVPDDFVTIKTTRTENKSAIKKAIQSGIEINFAELTHNERIEIK